MAKTFMYFAYGSNLLTKRLHINNPSAVKIGAGKLKDYKLDFNYFSKRWQGAAATIIPKEGSHVWGAVYEMNQEHMKTLDIQEGVADQVYFPMEVNIELATGENVKCRVYQQVKNPIACDDWINLPEERRPSTVYLNVIKAGANETQLPPDYIKFLHEIPDNGFAGSIDINETN